jgi:hypothetical protein
MFKKVIGYQLCNYTLSLDLKNKVMIILLTSLGNSPLPMDSYTIL